MGRWGSAQARMRQCSGAPRSQGRLDELADSQQAATVQIRMLDVFEWAIVGLVLWIVALPITLSIFFVLTIVPPSQVNIWMVLAGLLGGGVITGMMILGCKTFSGKWPWEYVYPRQEPQKDSKPPKP